MTQITSLSLMGTPSAFHSLEDVGIYISTPKSSWTLEERDRIWNHEDIRDRIWNHDSK